MRKTFSAVLVLGVLPIASALPPAGAQEAAPQQFLSWEHALTTRSSKSRHALAKAKIYNNWTNGKHRLLVKYNLAGLGGSDDLFARYYGASFSMPSFDPSRAARKLAYHNGALGIVQNLEADKLIAYSSDAGEHGEYFSENRKALMKRLRFDPWKKIAPELSKDEVPRLTPAQRTRLGREVRALMRPMLKDVMKTYFRALPRARVFGVGTEKIEARGYRLTMLLNAGGYYEDEQWMRVSTEWWLAAPTPGDAVAVKFFGQALADYRELGGPTTSMWMNESLPVMWSSMPQEFHLALNTVLPDALAALDGSTPGFKMGGTPVYAAATVLEKKPKMKKCPDCGQMHVPIPGQFTSDSLRVEMKLQERHHRTLAPRVFDAPAEYDKESLEPVLKQWDEAQKAMQGAFDGQTLLSKAPHETPVYSWRALRNYVQKSNALLLRAH
jgi:hypothetical protein